MYKRQELANNPRLLTGGVSELADVTDIQDRINKTIADRLMDQDFGVFPQKWGTGYPDDAEVEMGRDRMITTDVVETRFGQFTPADIAPLIAAKVQDTRDIAARTRTPAQYLLGEMTNVNGETLKASESGLVSKCRERQRPLGVGATDTARLIRKAAGLPMPNAPMRVIWRNPEFRTMAETMDAAVKGLASGMYDLRYAREFVGMSQTEIQQVEEREATTDPTTAAVLRTFNAAAGVGQPGVTDAGSAGV